MLNLLVLEPFLTPILFIFIAIVLITGFLLIRSIYQKEKVFEKKREGEFSDYQQVLTQAHIKAEQIMEQAAGEAAKMSRDSDVATNRIHQNIDTAYREIIEKNLKDLDSSSHEMLTTYQSYLQSLKTKYESELDTLVTTIQTTTQADFTNMQNNIKEKMIGSENGVSKKIADEFAATQIEINEYKKHKIQEVNKNIDKMILKIAESVLCQAIPLAQHQQLIVEALEKAQREGMFEN